eukprot:scaffold4.g4832.t1
MKRLSLFVALLALAGCARAVDLATVMQDPIYLPIILMFQNVDACSHDPGILKLNTSKSVHYARQGAIVVTSGVNLHPSDTSPALAPPRRAYAGAAVAPAPSGAHAPGWAPAPAPVQAPPGPPGPPGPSGAVTKASTSGAFSAGPSALLLAAIAAACLLF